MMETIRIVYISIPRDEAKSMARKLVEERLAACVNILPKIEAYYWWDDAVQYDEEALLLVKTTQAKFDPLVEYILEHHPYDMPEVVALPLADGLPEYVAWVRHETQSD